MKINTKRLSSIIALILLTSSILTIFAIDVNAQYQGDEPLPAGVTPEITVQPTAYLSFRPNPVGVNQPILVNIWTSPATHGARYHTGYKVTITKPDGATDIINKESNPADATAWFEYTPDQVGTYTLKFDFAGGYFPAANVSGGFMEPAIVEIGPVYYAPDSTEEQTLTVQEDIVYSWPPADLPTDYWTRPVIPNNREWWSILGNYPWMYDNPNYDFAGPYVIAPESAHVVWKRQGDVSGLIGGDLGILSRFEAGIGTNSAGYPPVIFEGRCYQTVDKPGVGNVAQCYDLRTGEIYYEIPMADGGVTPTAIGFTTASLAMNTNLELLSIGSNLVKIDPFTGAVTADVPGMSGTFHNGAYVLSVQNLGGGNYRLINWTTAGSTSDFDSRVVSNITWPWNNLGTAYDYATGVAVRVSTISGNTAYLGQEVTAVDMNTGTELWTQTIDEGPFSSSCDVAEHGKIAILTNKGHYYCYDLLSGNLEWISETMDYPWDAPGFGAYDIGSAYGMFYKNSYSGVYAFNWDDGTIAWKYEDITNPYETPYIDAENHTVNSWNGGMLIADGKVYDYNTEHSPVNPLPRGWRLHCIDALTGDGIWNITGFSGSRNFRGSVADGYLVFDNFYDAYMYVIGKGKSETTITTPDVSIPKGTAFTIKGTVLDLSPAQEGTPCVSVGSMRTQMEYLHFQQPIDGMWHNETIIGVPVTLTAVSPSGQYVDIGTVTTDGYYGTFGMSWTPTEEGMYKIIASFAGDASYGSSGAASYITVGPAASATTPIEPEQPTPEEPTTPEQPTPSEPTPEEPTPEQPTPEEPAPEEPEPTVTEQPLISTELTIAIAIVAACIIGAVAYLALKRRK